MAGEYIMKAILGKDGVIMFRLDEQTAAKVGFYICTLSWMNANVEDFSILDQTPILWNNDKFVVIGPGMYLRIQIL